MGIISRHNPFNHVAVIHNVNSLIRNAAGDPSTHYFDRWIMTESFIHVGTPLRCLLFLIFQALFSLVSIIIPYNVLLFTVFNNNNNLFTTVNNRSLCGRLHLFLKPSSKFNQSCSLYRCRHSM